MQQFLVTVVVKCQHEKDAKSYLEALADEYCGGPGELESVVGESWNYLGKVKFTNNTLDVLSLKEFREEAEAIFDGCEVRIVQELS